MISALNNMAMNHTIVSLEETGEHVGDPMEIKLFEFGEFQFSNEQSDNSDIIMAFESERGHKGFVYRRFDFDSQLFRMSAIGKTNHSGNDFHLYIKGSPEHMLDIFKSETVPNDYNQILKEYTSQGFRVLAIGCRKVDEKALNLSRLELEKDITFEGFEIFENRLKPETRGAIEEFVQAEVPCVMITGDNALTGSNIAYQCGISDPAKKTIICNFNSQTNALEL
jgi:cation-transporting ATPase 13A2